MMSKLKSLWSRYSITIVMIPSLIGMHYGWLLLQNNRSLVSEEEQIDLPVVTFAKYCMRRLQGDAETISSSATTKPVPVASK